MTNVKIRNLFFDRNGWHGLFGYHGWASMGATERTVATLLDELEYDKTTAPDVKVCAEKLIGSHPDYLDAYYVAGHAAYRMRDYRAAAGIFGRGLEIAQSLIPDDYQGTIAWGGMENQAFLRIVKGYVESLTKLGQITQARQYAAKLLRWDPEDNVGIGRILAELNFVDVA